MKDTKLKRYFDSKGITMEDIVNAGIPKGTAIGHLYGTRGISFATAQKYHDGLGIPLQDLMQFVLADRNSRKIPPVRDKAPL